MNKLFKLLVIGLFLLLAPGILMAETLTFQWNQPDATNLKEWRLYWSDSVGGPYDIQEIAVIPYSGGEGPFTTSATPEVPGQQSTFVKKYFVLVACGDLPQSDGTTKYECSENSNEVSHDFWIPAGKFSVPIQFEIVVTP